MIAYLRGIVLEIEGSRVVIDVQGVGYEVFCSRGCLSTLELGTEASFPVFTEVKEESLRLYGFDDRLERQVFIMLTQVKGVGAKSASDILSQINKVDLLRLIGAGESSLLQGVKGIGKKTAARIIVELKDRVMEFVQGVPASSSLTPSKIVVPDIRSDAEQALQALGFPLAVAKRALESVGERALEMKDSGELVREALRYV